MTALSDQNGAQARLYKKAIVTHSGCCLSPRLREFLCGTPRTVLTEDAFDEDVLLSILPQRLIVTALQDTGKNPVLLFLGDACLCGSGPLLSLAYRLNGEAHTLPVWGKAGKVQMLPKALTSGQGAVGDVVCRLLLSGRHFLLVHRLALVLLPQLSRLLADVEAHPGFLSAMPKPSELMQHLRTKGPALTAHPKGVLVSYLDREGGVGRAVITVGVANSCLELCNADERSQGQPVGTLDAALAILPKQQQVKGKRTAEVFDLHADDASLGIAQLPEPIVPEQPLEQAVEAAPAAREEGLTESASQQEAVRRDEKATAASVPKDPRIAAAVLSIRSGDSAVEQREALLEVLDDEIRGPADWADAWVDHGLLEALIHRAGAAGDGAQQEDEEEQIGELVAQAAVAVLSAASDDAAAAQCMVARLREALALGLPGLVLLRLLLAVADLPAVCKVAMTGSLGNAIAEHVEALCVAKAPAVPGEVPTSDRTSVTDDSAYASFRSPKGRYEVQQKAKQAPVSLGGLSVEIPGVDVISGADGDHVSEDRDKAPQIQASSQQWAPARSGPINVPVSSSKPAFVPKLLLPTSQSPGAIIGGLTRSTRRNIVDPRHGSLASTPLARTHSPAFGTPPTSFREEDKTLPVTASAELAALGSALGESLVAADLATIISHKRQATLRRTPSSALALHLEDHSRSLDAHRILLTARSSSSAVSPRQTGRGSSLGSPAGRLQHEESVDSQRMCLLLEALLAVAPLLAECAALQSPACSLASHLIAQAKPSAVKGGVVAGCSERQRKLSIAVLHYFAAEVPRGVDIIQQPGVATRSPHAPTQASNGALEERHPMVHGVAAALAAICSDSSHQVFPAQSFKEASALLDLLHDYLLASPAPSLPAIAETACSAAVRDLQRGLMASGPLHSWPHEALSALQALFRLDTTLLQRCQDACLGMDLIQRLVRDRRAANFRADIIRTAAQLFEHGASDLQSLLVACLDQYTALAGLLGRQPAVAQVGASHPSRAAPVSDSATEAEDATSADGGRGADILVKHTFQSNKDAHEGAQRGTSVDTYRAEALKGLAFLVDSPKGVAVRLLTGPASAATEREQSGPEARAALRLLAAVWGAPGNPFLGSKHAVDQAVHLHFLHFAKLFHGRSLSEATTTLCRLHLEVLRAMARSTGPAVRRRFYQLRVMDLLVRELSLEYEAALQARLPPAPGRLASAASGGTDFLSSPSRPGAPQGDASSQTKGPSTPFLNKAGQPFRVPPLQLSPAPSATALDLRGLAGHSTPPKDADSGRSAAITGREASFGSMAAGQDGAAPLSTHGSRPTTAGKPPLGSSRPTARGRGSPARSSRLSASQRPSSAPSSGRPFAAPSGGIPSSAATPRLGRANTAVPRLLLQSAMLHATKASGSSRSDEGFPSASTAAGEDVQEVPQPSADVLQCSESAADEGSASDSSSDDESSPSSDCESEASGGGTTRTDCSLRQDAVSSKAAAPFQFTGDLDADVAALEALEDASSYYTNCDTQRTCSSTGWTPRPTERLPAGANAASSSMQLGAQPCRPPSAEVSVPQLNLMGSLRLSQHSSSDQTPSDKGYGDAAEGGLGSLEQRGMGVGKMQAAMEAHNSAEECLEEPVMVLSYSEERARRVLYQDKELQLLVLEVVLELLLNDAGQLDPLYSSHQPLERRQQNIPHLLHHHLNHPSNAALAAPLLASAARIGPAATRLLRLLCSSLFQPGLYSHRRRLARGAYAQVYTSSFTETGVCEDVALKVIDIPSSIHDPCYQVDVFSEVSILERFRGQNSVCQLLNYGLEGDSIVLVMRKYAASLRAWRARITSPPAQQLRLYLQIFADIVAAKQVLALDNVVHFDLKCDNVLLEPVAGASDADFWRPGSARPPFRIVLADFGESRMYASADGAVTVRNRGTEYVKSPEMLLVGNAQRADRHGFDRRRREGAGPPADVWALGCLLYELVTGDFLFYDPDWIRFFVRLAQPGQELIPPERLKAVAGLPGVVELLEYMLVRDPCRRPSLDDIALRVDQLLRGKKVKLPAHQRPASAAAGGRQGPAGAGGTDVTPKQQQLLQPAISNASELSVRYSLAEHYLNVLTPLTDRLLIGSKEALSSQHALRQHSITHVLLLCCGPQSSGEGLSGESGDGAACLDWVLSDAGLTAAIANCTATEAVCRVVPLGALPCGSDAQEQGSEQHLLEAMPSILEFINTAEAGPSRAPKVSQASSNSGGDLVRRRTSSSSSGGEGAADSFIQLPGQVPSSADGLWRSDAQPEGRRSTGEAPTGPASARLPSNRAAASREGTRSNPASARTSGPTTGANVSTAQRWLKAQGRRAGSPAACPAGQRGRGEHRVSAVSSCEEGGRVLVAAAAGYEGEAAVVAIAHIMRQGLSPHEALVAASQRHVALHLQDHNQRQLAAWARLATM